MEFININGVNIHYKFIRCTSSLRSENTFVCINALGTDFRIWDGVVPILNAYGNILLFDKRGHGLSDVAQPNNGLFDFADDLMGLIEKLNISKITLIGLSVGGLIAQIIADKKPVWISKLILCDTRHQIGTVKGWNDRIETVENNGLASISENIMKVWFSEKFRYENSEKVAGYKNMVERTPVLGYIHCCKGLRAADLTEQTKKIKIPTLVLAGSEDKSTLPEKVKDLADLIEGAVFKIIEGSGHLLCVDNPRGLVDLISDF